MELSSAAEVFVGKQGRKINARLPEDLAEKLDQLQSATDLSLSELVKLALEQYYAAWVEAPAAAKSLIKASGLIGCADGDARLSETYKEAQTASLRKKL